MRDCDTTPRPVWLVRLEGRRTPDDRHQGASVFGRGARRAPGCRRRTRAAGCSIGSTRCCSSSFTSTTRSSGGCCRRPPSRPTHGADDEADQLEAEARSRSDSLALAEAGPAGRGGPSRRRSSGASTRRSAGSGTPATPNAEGTPRPTASSAARSPSATTCRSSCGTASSRSRALSRLGSLLRAGAVRDGGHRRRRLHEHEHQDPRHVGARALEDEKLTQDLLGISTPTCVTPDTRATRNSQRWSLQEHLAVLFIKYTPTHTCSTR